MQDSRKIRQFVEEYLAQEKVCEDCSNDWFDAHSDYKAAFEKTSDNATRILDYIFNNLATLTGRERALELINCYSEEGKEAFCRKLLD